MAKGQEKLRSWLERWGAWVLAVPAFGLTLALIWAATWRPFGSPGAPHDLPRWLMPSAQGTAFLCVGLWLASLFAFWWPRRNQRRSWELLGIGGSAALAVILGLASTAPCNSELDDSILTPIWHTMVLFVGTSPAPFSEFGNCYFGASGDGVIAIPLAAQAARFAAMAAVFGAAIALALKFGEQQWSRIRAKREYLPQVVIGIDEVGLPLVRSLVDWREKKSDVAVLALEGQEAGAAEARELGARGFVIRSRSSGRVTTAKSNGNGLATLGQNVLRERDLQQLVESIKPFITTRGRRFWRFGGRRIDVSTVWIMDGDLDRALLIREALERIAAVYAVSKRKPKDTEVERAADPTTRKSRKSRKSAAHASGDSSGEDGVGREIRVVVRCDDRLVAQRLRALWIRRRDVSEKGSRVLYDALSYNQVTAAELIGRVARDMAALDGPYTLVVCGDTALTEAVGAELMVRAWEEADLAAAWLQHLERCTNEHCMSQHTSGHVPPNDGDPTDVLVGGRMPTRVVFVDSLAKVVAKNLVRAGAPLGNELPKVGFVSTPWQGLMGDEFAVAVESAGDPPEVSLGAVAESGKAIAVIVTEEVPASRHHVAARINALLGPARCIVWHQPQAGEPQDTDAVEAGPGQTTGLRIETYRNDILMYGLWPEDSWIRAARHAHEAYRRVYFDETGPERNLWWHSDPSKKLKNKTRLDNIRQVHQALTGSLGEDAVWKAREPGGAAWEPSEPLLDMLGKAEHERWCRDRFADGWTLSPEKDSDKLTHPQLVDWDVLPVDAQARSILAGQRILQHLSASGFVLAGCDACGECQ